ERATLSGACRYQVYGRSSVVLALLLTAAALFFSVSAFAQGTTGTLRGQVLDPAGAVVPNAEVTVTNQETGVSVKVTTTSAGTYALPSLIPGVYKISVEARGFKSFVKKDVSVIANQDNVADAQVELGIATETIEVTGGSVEVQTTSSSLNNSFDSHSVDLPSGGGTLNGSMLNLAVLAPNVIAQPGGVTGIGGSVGGTRPRDNNFTVDGVDDNNLGVTGNNSTVIPDAVAEFNLTTNQFSAEYGHSAGGQFSLVTKTGTNNWHGSGEWYNQNRDYNSLDNLTKGAIIAKTLPGQPAFDNNRFGGTVGGPIIKNKLFVFGAYEYTYLHGQGSPTAFTAPTAAGLATLQANAADSAVSALLKSFPIAPATDAWTISGTLVNDLRLQYSFFGEQTINPCTACPQDITINDLLGGVTVGPGDFTSQKQNTYQISDTFSWSRGKHTFKFGGQYNHFIYPQFFLPRSNSDNQYNTA